MKSTFTPVFLFSALLLLTGSAYAQKFSRLKKIDFVGVKTDTGRSADVTLYQYSGNRSGDLKSQLIKFDNSTRMKRQFDYSPLDSVRYEEQSYDLVDRRLSKISKIKSAGGTTWIQEIKEEYFFNSTGEVNLVMGYVRVPPAAVWDEAYKMAYTYLAPGKIDTATTYEWVSGTWETSEQTVYSYSATYDTLSILLRKGRILANITLGNKAYAASGKIESEEWLNWNRTDKKWERRDQKLYFYDPAAKVDSVLYLGASGTGYAKKQRNIYTKDDSGNVVKKELQAWYSADGSYLTFNLFHVDFDKRNNPVTEVFLNYADGKLDTANRRTMTYNAYDQILSNTNEAYKAGIWAMGYGENKKRYTYEEFELGFQEQQWANSTLNLFPVPTNDHLEIKLDLPVAQNFTVLVYDITGRVWQHWNEQALKNYSEIISVRELPAGHYFIKINGAEGLSIVGRFAVSR